MPSAVDTARVAERFGLKLEAVGNGEYKTCCPFHNERTPSFRLYPGTRGACCYGCGWNGDAIDLARDLGKLSFHDAKASIGDEPNAPRRPDPYAGIRPDGEPRYMPVPGRDLMAWNPKLRDTGKPKGWAKYRPSAVYPYRSAAGALIGIVLRVETIGTSGPKKITPWLEWSTWCLEPGNEAMRRFKPGWCHTKPARPRPLYGLDLMARRPNAGVILVEGEKCADWLRKFGFLAICWPGGGNAACHADFTPLAGRRILAWPDADEPGTKAMTAAAALALTAGAASFRMIEPEADRPKGWDCADAVGWSRQDLVRWMQQRAAAPIPAPDSTTTGPASAGASPTPTRPAKEVTRTPADTGAERATVSSRDVAA